MHDIVVFAAIASLGVFVQSFFGFAGSLTAVPLFGLFLSPKEAIPAYALLKIALDGWLVFETREHVKWARVGGLILGGCIGTPIGAFGLKYLPTSIIQLAIGAVTFTFAVFFMLRIRINLKENTQTQLSVGLLSGVLNGSISESGPPVVIYGLAREWSKNVFRSTLLCYFFCLAIVAVVSFLWFGMISHKTMQSSSAALIPAFIVSNVGIRLKNRISDEHFRRGVLGIILTLSVVNLVHALW